MFCPVCNAEFRPGFTTCNECGVQLVDHLPEPKADLHAVESDYVVVKIVQGSLEEGQVCSFLEANGIPTMTKGESVRKTHGLTIDGLGAAQILVPANRAEDARELLARADKGELEIDE